MKPYPNIALGGCPPGIIMWFKFFSFAIFSNSPPEVTIATSAAGGVINFQIHSVLASSCDGESYIYGTCYI